MTEPSAGLEQEETEHDVDLIHECVVKMAKEISDFMDITPDKQRMDSLMVAANIRNLSLLELFYTCVANLCKIMDERGTKIPDEQYHYIKKDDYNKCIYHKRDMDATERNVVVMKDADILIKICDSTGDFDDTIEYQLLIRLLKERTIIDDGGSRRRQRQMCIRDRWWLKAASTKKRKLKTLQKYCLILLIQKPLSAIKQVADILDTLET